MSIISINKLELVSELSHNATVDELRDLYTEEELWKDDNGTDVYIEEAQEVFNRWYDYYEAIIDSCTINDINDRIYNGEEPSVVLGSYGLNINNFKKVGVKFTIMNDDCVYTVHDITDEYIEIVYSGELVRFTHNEFDTIKSLKPKIINDNQGD